MFPTTIAGSLPKPAWLAEPDKLWPQWRLAGADLAAGKLDATLLALKLQEDAGIDVVTDGEQSRQHFVHGFLEFVDGIDFAHKVEMGIRNDRYKAMVPTVTGALQAQGPRARHRGALRPRPHRAQAQDHHARADDHHRHHRRRSTTATACKMAFAFADLLNAEARALEARRRRRDPVRRAGVQRLHGRGRDLGHRGAAPRHRRAQLHDRRAHLLRLRHQGQHRLEGDARRRVAAVRGDLPGAGGEPDRPGLGRVPQLQGADRAAVAAQGQGRRRSA